MDVPDPPREEQNQNSFGEKRWFSTLAASRDQVENIPLNGPQVISICSRDFQSLGRGYSHRLQEPQGTRLQLKLVLWECRGEKIRSREGCGS